MSALSRSVGAISFLLFMLNLFLPWFSLETVNVPPSFRSLKPVEALSNFYQELDPKTFSYTVFLLVPLICIYLGAVYCLVKPDLGGRICLIASFFLLAMIAMIYYLKEGDPVRLANSVIGSMREGFYVALISSLAATLTGVWRERRPRKKAVAGYTIYTDTDQAP